MANAQVWQVSDVPVCKLAIGVAAIGVTGYGIYNLSQRFFHCKNVRNSKSKEQTLRDEEFDLEPGAIFLNHGSYGTVPKRVSDFQQSLRRVMEQHPDRWFRRVTAKRFRESSETVASLIKAPKECVAMVTNATTAINCVLGSMQLSGDDEVMVTDWTYQAIKNTAEYVCQSKGIKCVCLTLDFPIESEDDLVSRFEAFLKNHPNIRVCVLDHITSATAILIPVKRLIQVLHSHDVQVLVDGAHAPGQLDLDMIDLDADYYTGNLHKWCFAPRGCAFLYVRQPYLDEVMPVVISWLWKRPFQERFEHLGTRDHTPLFCAGEALKFIDDCLGGQDAMMRHNSQLATATADLIAARWGTEKLPIPREMEAPNLRMIRLPMEGLYSDAYDIMMDLLDTSNIMVCTISVNGVHYCRISVNVYNELWEYERMAECMLRLRDRKMQERASQ